MDQYISKKLRVLLVRHEDLSLEPEKNFIRILDFTGINFSENIHKAIITSSYSSDLTEISAHDEHAILVNSSANLSNWKKRLTDDEIERIVTGTRDVADKYYQWREWTSW